MSAAVNLQIQIHDQLVPQRVQLAVLRAPVVVAASSEALRAELEAVQSAAAAAPEDPGVRNERSIEATRQAVRALGWNPNRYRVSSEALLKRIKKGDRVPSVNNVVDINNILSLESGWPVGSYNVAKLVPPVELRLGRAEEEYAAIGGNAFKLGALALFSDQEGPFGSVVRDSGRAIVDASTTEVMMVIVGFGAISEVEDMVSRGRDLLQRFASSSSVDISFAPPRR